METDAYNSTSRCKVQKHVCDENFFYQNFIRTFRKRQTMTSKNFFKVFSTSSRFSYLLCFIGFIFFVLYAYAKNPDCKKFRNGKFKIVDSELGMTFFIVREGKRQTEIMEGEKDSSVFVVKWVDDCSYTLTPTKETYKKYPELPEHAVLTVKITETTDSSYTQTSSASFADLVQTSEVIKLH
jgi:hypothetical protein